MAQDGITDAEADAMLCQLEGRVPSAYQETEETAKGPSPLTVPGKPPRVAYTSVRPSRPSPSPARHAAW